MFVFRRKCMKTKSIKTLGLLTCLTLVGCSQNLNFGKTLVKVDSMVDILTELTAGTSDVGIMDSIMANYYLSLDSGYGDTLMVVPDLVLSQEQYGIAARKDADYTAAKVSLALVQLLQEGTVAEIADRYGLSDDVIIDETYTVNLDELTGTSDWDYITNKGTLIIGYTVFAPIAFEEEGEFVGFDIDLAKAVGELLNLQVVFQEINWDTKEIELANKNIDLIWNGMTITEERQQAMAISIPYLANKQVAVIRQSDAAKYQTTADMNQATIVVESGSAGQSIVEKQA